MPGSILTNAKNLTVVLVVSTISNCSINTEQLCHRESLPEKHVLNEVDRRQRGNNSPAQSRGVPA